MQRQIFKQLERAIESEVLVRFTYRNNRLEKTERVVEPMTLAVKWRSWYLFAYCTLRQDYRLFRLGRIRDVELLGRKFLYCNYRRPLYHNYHRPGRTDRNHRS